MGKKTYEIIVGPQLFTVDANDSEDARRQAQSEVAHLAERNALSVRVYPQGKGLGERPLRKGDRAA